MSRLFFLVFTGKQRSDYHAHESPASMTFPLVVLAVLAVVAGFVFTPFNGWLGSWLSGHSEAESANWAVMLLSTLVGLLGIGLGYLMYGKGSIARDVVSGKMPWLHTLVYRKYYIDELYDLVFVGGLRWLGRLLEFIDIYIVDGAVRLCSAAAFGLGRLGLRLQNGQVQTYGLVTVLGLLILALALAGRRFFHLG
jgi:NADH-quinone oxidoreductase subunit L